MTFTAFILIFISIFLHVGWNFLSKKTSPSLAFYTLMSATATLLWLPFFCLSSWSIWELPGSFFGLLAGSIFGEIIYVGGLAYAYKRSDISLVYPVVRALPVLMVAAVGSVFHLGKAIGITGAIGMVLITGGCFFMVGAPGKRFWHRSTWSARGALKFVLLGALGTTLYTIFDSCALRLLHETVGDRSSDFMLAITYLFWVELLMTLGELLLIAFVLQEERKTLRQLWGHSWAPVAAGLCSSTAYALILMAMPLVSNVAYIQAFRQMSLPLGFLAGVWLLKEQVSRNKILALAFITLGLVLSACG